MEKCHLINVNAGGQIHISEYVNRLNVRGEKRNLWTISLWKWPNYFLSNTQRDQCQNENANVADNESCLVSESPGLHLRVFPSRKWCKTWMNTTCCPSAATSPKATVNLDSEPPNGDNLPLQLPSHPNPTFINTRTFFCPMHNTKQYDYDDHVLKCLSLLKRHGLLTCSQVRALKIILHLHNVLVSLFSISQQGFGISLGFMPDDKTTSYRGHTGEIHNKDFKWPSICRLKLKDGDIIRTFTWRNAGNKVFWGKLRQLPNIILIILSN